MNLLSALRSTYRFDTPLKKIKRTNPKNTLLDTLPVNELLIEKECSCGATVSLTLWSETLFKKLKHRFRETTENVLHNRCILLTLVSRRKLNAVNVFSVWVTKFDWCLTALFVVHSKTWNYLNLLNYSKLNC